MSSVVVTNSQTSCPLIHLNLSRELGPAQPQTAKSTPGIVDYVTRVAKRLRAFVPTIDSTSWVQSLGQVRKDRLSVETPAECLGAGVTVHSSKQQRRNKTLVRKDSQTEYTVTADVNRCDPGLQIRS